MKNIKLFYIGVMFLGFSFVANAQKIDQMIGKYSVKVDIDNVIRKANIRKATAEEETKINKKKVERLKNNRLPDEAIINKDNLYIRLSGEDLNYRISKIKETGEGCELTVEGENQPIIIKTIGENEYTVTIGVIQYIFNRI